MKRSLTSESSASLLRQLPSIHELISHEKLMAVVEQLGHGVVREAARKLLEDYRQAIVAKNEFQKTPTLDGIANELVTLLNQRQQATIRKVINATGVLLHTGLGRAPLASEAIDAVAEATRYCNVELDLHSGARTKRHELVQEDLCALTGAEAALVVNNNAGATGLVLAAFASGRELIVSHGQLIEIGGGFRLPDVFRAYGATLRAVGTTNRTRVEDYAAAINERTGAIMAIHTSNYQVVGFTQQPELEELVELTRDREFPFVHDIGSGAMVDFLRTSDGDEPLVQDSIAKGVGLVLFSGDKLLGGPQAGIIVGKRHLVDQLAQHPMSRALRVDKLTLAALQATLSIYRRAETDPSLYDQIPFLRMYRTPADELKRRASSLASQLSEAFQEIHTEAVTSEAFAGGGSLPGNAMDSWAVALVPTEGRLSIERLSEQLRIASPSIFGRVHDGRLLLDMRSVDPADDPNLLAALSATLSNMLQGHA